MLLQEGDEAIYQFPQNAEKCVKGIIEFLGDTVIHFKTVEGYSIKITRQYFDNLSAIETTIDNSAKNDL
ncbi:MAG: hypothetical protein KKF62_00305 [Bacteroidetes bacterium]|nr:hypothetical protein [Bacteroidota bacterium]MBU1114079.1 hypothetical protein [Bacteroidota bacterium]MBU1798178.1 hypothetical protein [Bacteroidota bacterium]